MPHSSRYVKGQWLTICDRCGFEYLAEDLKLEWDGFMVCPKCWEPRQPQDFVRAKTDIQAPPWTRPEGSDTFTNLVCTPEGRSSIPGIGIPGCSVPNQGLIIWDSLVPYSFCTTLSVRCVADFGTANCMTVGVY